jgi:hypothetical protein
MMMAGALLESFLSGVQLPKLGIHLGVWRFNSHTLPYSQPPGSMQCDSQASLLGLNFVSPCLGREPKASVATPKAVVEENTKLQKTFNVRH